MKFVTRIYHPNVKTDSGEICSDILNENWGPTLNVTYVLNTIRQASAPRSMRARARTRANRCAGVVLRFLLGWIGSGSSWVSLGRVGLGWVGLGWVWVRSTGRCRYNRLMVGTCMDGWVGGWVDAYVGGCVGALVGG